MCHLTGDSTHYSLGCLIHRKLQECQYAGLDSIADHSLGRNIVGHTVAGRIATIDHTTIGHTTTTGRTATDHTTASHNSTHSWHLEHRPRNTEHLVSEQQDCSGHNIGHHHNHLPSEFSHHSYSHAH